MSSWICAQQHCHTGAFWSSNEEESTSNVTLRQQFEEGPHMAVIVRNPQSFDCTSKCLEITVCLVGSATTHTSLEVC